MGVKKASPANDIHPVKPLLGPTAPPREECTDAVIHTEPQERIRSLCRYLVNRQDNVLEFQRLLARYPDNCDDLSEPEDAKAIRDKLGQCVCKWTGEPFRGFSVAQVQMWRAIVVEKRLNLSLAPGPDARD